MSFYELIFLGDYFYDAWQKHIRFPFKSTEVVVVDRLEYAIVFFNVQTKIKTSNNADNSEKQWQLGVHKS